MPSADYDQIVLEVGDAIVLFAANHTVTASLLADRFGWTRPASTAVLHRLQKAGRLQIRRPFKIYGPVEYHALAQ